MILLFQVESSNRKCINMLKTIAHQPIYLGERFETEGIFIDSLLGTHHLPGKLRFIPISKLPNFIVDRLKNNVLPESTLLTGELMEDGGIFIDLDLNDTEDLASYEFIEYAHFDKIFDAVTDEIEKRAKNLGLRTDRVLELLNISDTLNTDDITIELINSILDSITNEAINEPLTVSEAIEILQSLEPTLPLVLAGDEKLAIGSEIVDISYEILYVGDSLDPQNAQSVALLKQRSVD